MKLYVGLEQLVFQFDTKIHYYVIGCNAFLHEYRNLLDEDVLL